MRGSFIGRWVTPTACSIMSAVSRSPSTRTMLSDTGEDYALASARIETPNDGDAADPLSVCVPIGWPGWVILVRAQPGGLSGTLLSMQIDEET